MVVVSTAAMRLVVKSSPPTSHHPTFLRAGRRMPFLSPNQQCQSTEGKTDHFARKYSITQLATSKIRTVGRSEVRQRIVALLLRHYLGHHAGVVGERRDTETFHDDVRQMIRIQHEMLAAVLEHVLVVLALILQYLFHCFTNKMQSGCNVDYCTLSIRANLQAISVKHHLCPPPPLLLLPTHSYKLNVQHPLLNASSCE